MSQNKTEVIKQSDTEKLVKLLTEERQLIQQVEQYEVEREEIVAELFNDHHLQSNHKTITELLDIIDDDIAKEELEQSVAILIQLIISIRESEQLNNELLQQSMQFVQLSLDMIQPESQAIHYGSHAKRKDFTQQRSVFDSKV